MPTSTLFVGSARIDVITDAGGVQPRPDEVMAWVKAAAESVSTYFGRFPVPQLAIEVTPFQGRGVRHGMCFPADHGGRITIGVGSDTTAEGFASDWTLTHEMIHLGFPSVNRTHHWIEEGLATYIEPIARIQAGHLSADQMWSDLLRDMPQGLPEEDDRGLDRTHTWGRTYWGGAIFCLIADVKIRRETNNAKGLQHALRAILAAGGDIRHDWDLPEALKVGDTATGTHVLETQYEEMRDKPSPIDLEGLWKQLGVHSEDRHILYDDAAPLASIRRAIITPLAPPPHPAAQNLPAGPAPVIVAGRTPANLRPQK